MLVSVLETMTPLDANRHETLDKHGSSLLYELDPDVTQSCEITSFLKLRILANCEIESFFTLLHFQSAVE